MMAGATISGILPVGTKQACVVPSPHHRGRRTCAMAYRMAEGINWDDFDEAVSAIAEVGPGGHYLGHPHTLENFQRAFFMPNMFDNNSIEQWQAEGSVEITERALTEAKSLLRDYEEPKLDEAVHEQLRDYIARRETEIPAADALNQEF